ncbi:hypothetical protein [Actinomadura sp. NPDC000600]|uniref:hypothetical protein n=1 Tax=Actinomadura sp. NPDC000600 TaxID=3154262 RepID=UPI00339B6935
MKGKHSKQSRRLRLAPWAIGTMTGLATFGVTAALPTTLQHATIETAAAAQTVPQQQTAQLLAERRTQVGERRQARAAAQFQKEFKAPTKAEATKSRSSTKVESKPVSAKKQAVPQQQAADPKAAKRALVIKRAKSWHPHTAQRVPYSQTGSHNGYRTDCSGYVSMALGLPKPGPNTVGLTSSRYTQRIKMSQLKKGDLVMDALGSNTTRHVVIFEKWANKQHTSYWAYEQRGRYGTDHRTLTYGLSSGDEYKAYRPTSLK